MKAFVTGATGFVGAHLARVLLRRGAKVRCLVRESSRLDNLDGLSVETVCGDLTDPQAVRSGMQGCGLVFHCAADYRLYVPSPESMYASMLSCSSCGRRKASRSSVVNRESSRAVDAMSV